MANTVLGLRLEELCSFIQTQFDLLELRLLEINSLIQTEFDSNSVSNYDLDGVRVRTDFEIEFDILHGVKREMEKISFALSTVRAVIEDAETRQHTDMAIAGWLRRLSKFVIAFQSLKSPNGAFVRRLSKFAIAQVTPFIASWSDYKHFLDRSRSDCEFFFEKVHADFDSIAKEISKFDLKTSVVLDLKTSVVFSPKQNLNILSRLMVVLKRTKDLVAIRGKWDMVAWLKNVRELQVDKIMEEFNKETEEFFPPNYLDDKDSEFNTKLIESLTAVKVLIEEGNAGSESIPVHLSSLEKYQLKLFSSEDLMKLTDFNKKLGSGGYSDVYQGEFEGEQVAVKILKKNGMVYETFLTERITMSRFSHTNLVKLYGFCFDDDIKALVYEYMERGSLDEILYKNPETVEWPELYRIVLEIARGLAYLHHSFGEQIIHHDVKAANVLLDKNLCAKITDFGVSNLMKSDATHITNTRTRGTDCYSAPEVYLPFFPLSCKCDVYSFGIMMFEILGRRQCSVPIKGEIWFPKEVSKMWNEHPESVLEHCKIKEKDRKKAMIVLMVALWCAQYTPKIRPSMSDVVEVLEKEMSVTVPPHPFKYHNPLGHSMVPSLQGTLEVHTEVPVNDNRWAIFKNNEALEEFLRGLQQYSLKRYSGMDLAAFTSGFSESNIIGIGSVGKVYKGKFPDGPEVAIKVFAHDNIIQEEFLHELRTLSRSLDKDYQHRNIVRTYGYCFDKKMKAIVYEYMPCGSLDKILDKNHHISIEWGMLYDIVMEIASGLSYLHENCCIIHSDVKPRNILVDHIFCPKIRSSRSTKGTPGYSAPEMWMEESQETYKADVYSFGIMMFEVLGRRSNHSPGQCWFPEQVWEKFETGQIELLIQDCGIEDIYIEHAKILSMVALWCVQYTPQRRPFMSTVVKMLRKKQPVTNPPYPFQLISSLDDDDDDYYDDDDDADYADADDDYDYAAAADSDDVDTDSDEKEEESESLLKLYEEKCPPGGENSVVIYTSTVEKTRRLFKESNDVRTILQSHQIKVIERDVWGDGVDYEDELNDLMGRIQIPLLFVKGRLIGAADEVKRLEATGELKVLLYGIATEK